MHVSGRGESEFRIPQDAVGNFVVVSSQGTAMHPHFWLRGAVIEAGGEKVMNLAMLGGVSGAFKKVVGGRIDALLEWRL